MFKLKKWIPLVLAGISILSLSACSFSSKPYVELCDFSKLKLQKIKTISELTDDEKQEVLDTYAETQYDDELLDKAAEKGDEVLISYEVYENGSVLYDSDHEYIVLGNNTYSDEIENAVVGKKAGDQFDVEIKGESADDTFKITLNNVVKRTYKEIDENLAKDNGFNSLEELKESLYAQQVEYLNYLYAYESNITAFEVASGKSTFNDCPKDVYNKSKEELDKSYVSIFGKDLDDYYDDKDQVKEIVTQYANQNAFVDEVCELDNYTVSDEEVEEYKRINFKEESDYDSMTDEEIVQELRLRHSGSYVLSKAQTVEVDYDDFQGQGYSEETDSSEESTDQWTSSLIETK